jgi:S1/P1 Nuclease
MKSIRAALAALSMALAAPAFAWGDLGHQVTALIAYQHLNAKTRPALDALLATDADTLTPPDFASRTTWADR